MKRFMFIVVIIICLSSILFSCSHPAENAVPRSESSVQSEESKVSQSDSSETSSESEQNTLDKETCKKYVEALGFFLNSSDWETPSEITPSQFVMWYGYQVNDLPTVGEYLIDDKDGLFFPEQEFEEAISKHFAVTPDHLRSDLSVYLEAEHLYRTPAAIMPLAESTVEILDVIQEGSIISIEFSLNFAEFDSRNIVLEVEESADGFKFLSYKSK